MFAMSVTIDIFSLIMSHIFLILYMSSHFFVYRTLQMIYCEECVLLSSTKGYILFWLAVKLLQITLILMRLGFIMEELL